MENRINIAKLLKDCPKGMELDCTMYGCVFLEGVMDDEDIDYPILIKTKYGNTCNLTSKGCWGDSPSAECVIFPKGKTSWEGFQGSFKDGDIVFYNDTIAIFKEWGDETLFKTYVTKYLCCDSLIDTNVPLFGERVRKEIRLATEEERKKLLQAIKDNGYKWNAETKSLEKLISSKFKVEDKVMKNKILELLREMTNDSKSVSYKAEKELCNILTEVINKLHAIEKTVGWSVRNYPDKIESIDVYGWYDELPKEIDCNDNDFCFKTEWLDINLQEYFEELRKKKIGSIKYTITHVEYSLGKHREDLERIEELKFEDLKI